MADALQYVTEQVAAFKLLPRTFRNLSARIARLQGMPAVQNSPDLRAGVESARQSLMDVETRYNTVNVVVDTAIAEGERAKVTGITFAAVAALASAATGMTQVFASVRAVTDAVADMEARVLSPAEVQGAASYTGSAFGGAGGVVKLALIAAGFMAFVPAIFGGRRR